MTCAMCSSLFGRQPHVKSPLIRARCLYKIAHQQCIKKKPRRSGAKRGIVNAPTQPADRGHFFRGKSQNDVTQNILNDKVALRLGFRKSLLCSPRFRARRVHALAFMAFVHLVRSTRVVFISPCSDPLADNSFCTAARSKSSLGCLMQYSGGWPSSAGLCPVTMYVPRGALTKRSAGR